MNKKSEINNKKIEKTKQKKWKNKQQHIKMFIKRKNIH